MLIFGPLTEYGLAEQVKTSVNDLRILIADDQRMRLRFVTSPNLDSKPYTTADHFNMYHQATPKPILCRGSVRKTKPTS